MQTTDASRSSRTSCTIRTCASRASARRREALASRLHRQRAARRRPQGPRRGDGRQEPQGHRPPRRPAYGDRRPRVVQGRAQAHARRHEGQPRPVLAVRPIRHLGQRRELHGPRHLPVPQLDYDGHRRVPVHDRPGRHGLARRRPHRLRRVPRGLQPAAPCGDPAVHRHHDRGTGVRDPLLVRRRHRRHQPGRHHRRRSRRRRVRPRHDVGRCHHRLRHGALRARHPHHGGHRRPRPALRRSTRPWSSCSA